MLKKPRSPSQDSEAYSYRAPQAQKVEEVRYYGRKEPPPPPGSGYDSFVEWASEGCLDPSQEEIDLAMSLWMGIQPDQDCVSQPSYSPR